MHYEIEGALIKTENAAKPISQASKHLLNWIDCLRSNLVVLDYGCGKFRYTIPLARRVSSVYAVDSMCQIEREQMIAGVRTTLRNYAKRHAKNVCVCDVESDKWRRRRYGVILCANVLSAIPIRKQRQYVLKQLNTVLRQSGQLLVTTQYRNTHFNSYERSPDVRRYLDGWLGKSRQGNFFYGVIPPHELERLCVRAGFNVLKSGSKGETAYVLATK